MKKQIFLTALVVVSAKLLAQVNNPYKDFGYLPTNEYVQTKWRSFELYNADTVSEVKGLLFDYIGGKVFVKGKSNEIIQEEFIGETEKMRFLSVDPLTKSYPWYTPYQFAGNKPIIAKDLDGMEEQIVIYNMSEGQIVTTTTNGKKLLQTTQYAGSFAVHKKITSEQWRTYKASMWKGFSAAKKMFSSGYDEYTMGMKTNNSSGFTGLNSGTLTIGAFKDIVASYDPAPVKDNDMTFKESLALGWKGFKTFNPIYPIPDKSIDGSEAYANTIGNVRTVTGLVLTGPGVVAGGFTSLASTASVLNGLDDVSGMFPAKKDELSTKTLLQRYLGDKAGNATKTGLSLFGVAGGITGVIEGKGLNLNTTRDATGGGLDVISSYDNAKKAVQ